VGIKDKSLKKLKLGETHMADAKRASSSTRTKKKSTKDSKKTTVEKLDSEIAERTVVTVSRESLETLVEEPKESSVAPVPSESATSLEENKVEPIRTRLSDEYLIQCYFDKAQNQFVAMVLELSQIRAVGSSKADVIRDCENRLESHLNLLKRQGESIPETFQSRHYPESLTIPISQSLYRRLDLLSRQEKTGLDELVVELISGMVERRLHVANRHQNQRPHQHGHQGGHRDNHRNENRREGHKHEAPREQRREPAPREKPRDNNQRDFQNDEDNIGNLKREPHSMQQGRNNRNRGGGRHFHKTMESRENFLEYVRNLEKGSWKKR
jgi:predicted RNase H-like HicB family nuclease